MRAGQSPTHRTGAWLPEPHRGRQNCYQQVFLNGITEYSVLLIASFFSILLAGGLSRESFDKFFPSRRSHDRRVCTAVVPEKERVPSHRRWWHRRRTFRSHSSLYPFRTRHPVRDRRGTARTESHSWRPGHLCSRSPAAFLHRLLRCGNLLRRQPPARFLERTPAGLRSFLRRRGGRGHESRRAAPPRPPRPRPL